MELVIERMAKIAPIVRFETFDSVLVQMGVGYEKERNMLISVVVVEPAAVAVVVAPTVLEVSSVDAVAEEALVDNWDVVGVVAEGDRDDRKVLEAPHKVLRAKRDGMW